MRNTVFISYPSEDAIIAERISAAITSLPENKLDVFLDRINMQGGQRIPSVLQKALKETIYFVAIATNVSRRNFDWCGQELGFYQGSYSDDNRRETCLFHQTPPELFVGLRNYKAQSVRKEHRNQFGAELVQVGNSEFHSFLKGIAKLNAELHPPPDPEAYYNRIPSWADTQTVSIAEGFFSALENRVEDTWYPQGRLQLSIDRGDFYKEIPPQIPLDAEITLSGSIYNIFALSIPSTIRPQTWDEFIKFSIENTGGDTLTRIMSDIIISVLPARADAKSDYVFQAPNLKFYRVLLVRHSIYANKRREMIINLIETLEKVKAGEAKTTALVAGIVLGSKYRSIFHEPSAKYGLEKLRALERETLVLRTSEMLRDIDRINADAASDGLADFSALEQLLGSTDEIKSLFKKWWEIFPQIEDAAKQLDTTDESRKLFFDIFSKFLVMSLRNNTKFLKLCLSKYLEFLPDPTLQP